jgi:uncharacterized protein (TIGR03086 family)
MLQDLRAATDWAAGVFDGVDIDRQASLPTPCTQWDVRVLMTHVVAWNRLFAAGLLGVRPPDDIITAALNTGPGPTEAVPDLIGRSPGHAYRTSTHELLAVLSLDDDLAGTCHLPVGELTAATVFTMALVDNLVHGWDLATATGQPFDLPEPTLQAVWEYLTEFLPTLPEPVRASWGAAVPVPPDASLLDRIVGMAGRKP